MVRPESCIESAGGSPDRESGGAPGSRHRYGEEIPHTERCVKSPAWRESEEAGRNKVNISASTNYQPKGVRESRAAHVHFPSATASLNSSAWVLFGILEIESYVSPRKMTVEMIVPQMKMALPCESVIYSPL